MAANGGGPPPPPPPPPFMIKKEGGFDENGGGDDSKPVQELDDGDDDDDQNHHVGNNMKGISIAERRAAKCGFNSANINNNNASARTGLSSPHAHGLQSPYVTIPPGISPSALLDSPILLSNAQAQLSPTTGTFHQFPLSPNPESLKLKLKLLASEEEEDDSTFIPMDSSSNSKPDSHSAPDNITVENSPFEDYFEYPRDFRETSKNDCLEDTRAKTHDHCLLSLQQPSNTRNQMFREIRSTINNYHHHQKGVAYIPNKEVSKHSEDGFYWRKYGQKHVKGSEFPRSYYKCTNANCLVKKKVERSHAGEITQIVYKGSHNHPIPQPDFNRLVNDTPDQMASHDDGGGGTSFKAHGAKDAAFGSDVHNSAASILSDFSHDHLSVSTFDLPQEFSSNNNLGSRDGEDQNQPSPESISYKDEDDENGECEPKKRKRENFPNETTIPRSARESKVVVQIESDVDILDDGYRWRKYGQKVVKGNPNPRSYYKCTTPRCPVRKHVERAADDIKSVLTTYEGKHNHDVPTSKSTSSLAISDHVSNHLPPAVANNNTVSNPSPMAQKHVHVSKAGKQVGDLPLYMERKPILNYNDFIRSNLPGFGAPSSLCPYSFPPFPSLAYNSLLMNGDNHMKTYSPSSKFYPMLPPDYNMSLSSSQTSHVPAGRPANIGGNFPFNNYAALQSSTRGHDQIMKCQTGNIMKPKEEEAENEGELCDTCLSIPTNHGNGSL